MAANVNAGDFDDLRLVDRVWVATIREDYLGVELGDLAMGRATHQGIPALLQDPLDQGSLRRGHVEGAGRDGRTDLLGRVPSLRSSSMPGSRSGECGTSNVLRDSWLGHLFHSEVVLAADRHPDAVYQAQVLKVIHIQAAATVEWLRTQTITYEPGVRSRAAPSAPNCIIGTGSSRGINSAVVLSLIHI